MDGGWMLNSSIMIFVSVVYLFIPISSQAQTRSIEGSWRGGGYFKPSSGTKEKILCRVNYSKITDKIFSFSGTCANPSGSVRQTGEVLRATINRYVGDFQNSEFGISGRIRIIVRGNRQSVKLTSSQDSGRLSLSRR